MEKKLGQPDLNLQMPVTPTLGDHLDSERTGSSEIAAVLRDIADACRSISYTLRRAALINALGLTGTTNVQGEEVQKLDEIADKSIINALQLGGNCIAYASEELNEPIIFDGARGDLSVTCDPLDGSSNLDVGASVGTIFGLLPLQLESKPAYKSFLQPGHKLVAAGYAVYGPSTILIIAANEAVHGYTFDPGRDEWFLTHENLICKPRGNVYSINEGYKHRWESGISKWIKWITEEDSRNGRPHSLRYTGSFVADAHRTLIQGGIFAYPADKTSPTGKLRLSYEANPLAFIFDIAGGVAIDGNNRILEIVPTELHQRTPLIIGSVDNVSEFRNLTRDSR